MTLQKTTLINVKTGEKTIKEIDMPEYTVPILEKTDIEKLIEHAKGQGWI